jgi:uncharacterized protein DUF1203
MQFVIAGLDPSPLLPLFALSDAELAARDVRRSIADARPGFPCRVSLDDATVGEELLLLPFRHHDVASPYRAEGPVFVRRAARARFVDELPPFLASRQLSLRAYDAAAMLVAADVVPGADARGLLARQLADAAVAYVHIHFARPGCFACRVDRA